MQAWSAVGLHARVSGVREVEVETPKSRVLRACQRHAQTCPDRSDRPVERGLNPRPDSPIAGAEGLAEPIKSRHGRGYTGYREALVDRCVFRLRHPLPRAWPRTRTFAEQTGRLVAGKPKKIQQTISVRHRMPAGDRPLRTVEAGAVPPPPRRGPGRDARPRLTGTPINQTFSLPDIRRLTTGVGHDVATRYPTNENPRPVRSRARQVEVLSRPVVIP